MSLKTDLEWFKRHTTNKIVIMGRKTFESMGRPLPNRINIILTKDMSYQKEGCYVVNSVEEVLRKWCTDETEVFVIGGAEIYNQFLPFVYRLYITQIDAEFEGETYFPETDLTQFRTFYEYHEVDNIYGLTFKIYESIKVKNMN